MPVEVHPVFETPESDTVLWRFMSFAKFVDLLLRRQLWFSRTDLLGDPFEAAYTNADMLSAAAGAAGSDPRPRQGPFAFRDPTEDDLRRFSGHVSQWAAVSCWYGRVVESVAMWRFFGSGEAVAIRTDVARVERALNREALPVHIGRVQYVDFDVVTTDRSNSLYPLVQKRDLFADEREVRLVVLDPTWTVQTQSPPGRHVDVDLHELIEKVVVGPDLGPWFLKMVTKLLSELSIDCDIVPSRLDDRPMPRPAGDAGLP